MCQLKEQPLRLSLLGLQLLGIAGWASSKIPSDSCYSPLTTENRCFFLVFMQSDVLINFYALNTVYKHMWSVVRQQGDWNFVSDHQRHVPNMITLSQCWGYAALDCFFLVIVIYLCYLYEWMNESYTSLPWWSTCTSLKNKFPYVTRKWRSIP